MSKISLIIIYHRRVKHLKNTILGIANGTCTPDEILIIEMDLIKSNFDFLRLNERHILLPSSDINDLPLARARNTGAKLASYKNLVFLDVDCIPSDSFFKNIYENLPLKDGLYMGTPKYIYNAEINKSILLKDQSIFHPKRPKVKEIEQYQDYYLFWSLVFFTTKRAYLNIGGFDNQFTGYGGEDTDFAQKAKLNDISFYITPFVVYHQQHNFCSPPLNHFKAIIVNCNKFYKKWKIWIMQKHLKSFVEKNYIIWNKDSIEIILIQNPTTTEIKGSLVLDKPFG